MVDMPDNKARLVWAILSAIGHSGSPPSTVIETVHYRIRIPERDIREAINVLLARGHVILDGSGTLRRVPDSGIKATAMAYGLDEDDVAMVFHTMTGAVQAGDTETIDAALRNVVAAKAAAVKPRSRRRPDA